MAFHPLRTFQKNRKFWMASILLMCMATFVLCTGLQGGDFGGWIMGIISGRHGYEVTRIDGHTIYSKEIEDLKVQRDIANEFMRKALQENLNHTAQILKDSAQIKDDKTRKGRLQFYTFIQADLQQQFSKPRYFSDNKLQTLLDFIILRYQADRLGVYLNDDAVIKLVHEHIHAAAVPFDSRSAQGVQNEVKRSLGRYNLSEGTMIDALRDEFRVAIARRVLEQCPTQGLMAERSERNPTLLSWDWPLQIRMPVSPEQMHTFYRKHRAEAEVALIPINLEHFLKEAPKPDLAQLEALFTKHKDKKYDPSREEPGFEIPERIWARWISADPESKAYRDAARTVTTLEVTPAVLYDPNMPLTLLAANYVSRSAAYEKRLADLYTDRKRTREGEKYLLEPLSQPFALALYTSIKEPKAENVAAVVGGCALAPEFGPSVIAGYQTAAYFRQAKEKAPLVQAIREKRAPIYATMALNTLQPNFAAELVQRYYTRVVDQYQPLIGPLKEELKGKIELGIAQRWARANMNVVLKKLEDLRNGNLLEDALIRLKPRYHLSESGTTKWRNRFDIGSDPGMEPLKKAYDKWYDAINTIEGRGGTEAVLKEDDFSKLFFGAEEFSVGNVDAFFPRTWPPKTVTPKKAMVELNRQQERLQPVNLFTRADHAFLFWKTNHTPAKPAGSLQEVRDAVEHAWKVNKLRADIKPRLEKIIAAIHAAEKKDENVRSVVRQEAKKLGDELILLDHVAPWVEMRKEERGPLGYAPYALPKGKIPYAQEDTAKLVLAMTNLEKPLETGDKTVDEVNRQLFDARVKAKSKGKVIQVFANKPRTIYYVAVLLTEPRIGLPVPAPRTLEEDFFEAYRSGRGLFQAENLFVSMCQEEYGRTYREELRMQLRRNANMSQLSTEAQKQFEQDEARK